MNPISFFTEDIIFVLKGKTKIRFWVNACAKNEGKQIESLSYIFCSDKNLLEINKKFLKHNTLTDTITFDYSDEEKKLIGDIFISIERVKENAINFNVSFEEEIKRVIIHGFLHLCNYSDKTVDMKKKMVKKENTYLDLYKKKFHVEH